MRTVFDIYLSFPLIAEAEKDFRALHKACGSIENVEQAFDIEFSCGDNLYLSDFEDDDDELTKYDGKVCTDCVPRERRDGKEFKANKPYRFIIKYTEENEEVSFFLNSKLTLRKMSFEF